MEIRRASAADLGAVAQTLHEAFRDDPISTWVFPEKAAREELHPGFMRVFAGMGLRGGEVYLTPGAHAVAVWYAIRPGEPDESGDSDELLRAAGAAAPGAGPRRPVLGPAPRWRGAPLPASAGGAAGLPGPRAGRRAAADRLARASKDGLPAYLESSTSRSAALYARQGFAHRETIELPEGGPTVYPMWRA